MILYARVLSAALAGKIIRQGDDGGRFGSILKALMTQAQRRRGIGLER